ncbi:MAG: ribose 5-phosphate isomerase B [Muribaculaceae bacterium]|nr:ribose 5-phosphate isomerase B [Muribaculaceae bacterium]
MKIAIASDHAGYQLKEFLKGYLEEAGNEIIDFGTNSPESCDYPDYAHPAALAVESGECTTGIGICGAGNGMQITLNKHQGIRAALCWIPEIAELARKHNNANFLVLPARFISPVEAADIVDVYMKTPFEGGRHQKRVDKIPYNIPVEGEII